MCCYICSSVLFFFFKQKTAYEMRISDWSSDVCSSDLHPCHRADLIKRAMARMPAALADAGLSDVAMLLQFHDALVFEAPDVLAEAAVEVIRRVLMGAAEPVLKMSLPLEVEFGIGKIWCAVSCSLCYCCSLRSPRPPPPFRP